MTDCTQILERISAYIDQELDVETCRAIEQHCARCPDCARLVDSLRETIGLCRATADQPLPPGVRERALASIAQLLAQHGRN